MQAAHSARAKVLYVTDWSAAPVPEATWTIPCAVRGKELFDRYAAAMSLLHFLGVAVVNRLAAEQHISQRFENRRILPSQLIEQCCCQK